MTELDATYIALLNRGLPQLQNAIHGGQQAWALAEIEMLHNLPSLIGEPNGLRHLYYFDTEREAYITAICDIGGEAFEYMNTCYIPLWQDLSRLIDKFR